MDIQSSSHGATPTIRRSGTLQSETSGPAVAVRACAACRQMKMKCEGSENPPCVRCRKAKRACLSQVLHREALKPNFQVPLPIAYTSGTYHRTNSLLSLRFGRSLSTPFDQNLGLNFDEPDALQRQLLVPESKISRHYQPYSLMPNTSQNNVSVNQNGAALPSIYSTAPTTEVDVRSPFRASQSTRTSIGQERKALMDYGLLMTKSDMADMIRLFCERHLAYSAVFRPDEFTDTEYLIESELPFVYCICYITARYLPGGKETRDLLFPQIQRISTGLFGMQSGISQVDEICIFKCLILLCQYSDLTSPSRMNYESGQEGLHYWHLKSLAEVYGIRMSLHRSVQELKSQLRSNATGVSQTKGYKRYVYWLWLVTTANFCSIVSGTPPSIRIDSSIRAAPALAEQCGNTFEIALFAETELHLIWEKASFQDNGLGEWWCLPDISEVIDANVVEDALKQAGKDLDEWHVKWSGFINAEPQGIVVDYLGRFTRFCITSYAVKCLRSPPQLLSHLQHEQIQRCVSAAFHVLDVPLSASPIMKEKLRYVPDSSIIMISFCALFILSTCQTFTSSIPNIREKVEYIAKVGNLMIDLSINVEHKPYIQGMLVLRRVEQLKKSLEHIVDFNATPTGSNTLTEDRSAATTLDLSISNENATPLIDHGFFDMESIWDYSMLFPNSMFPTVD